MSGQWNVIQLICLNVALKFFEIESNQELLNWAELRTLGYLKCYYWNILSIMYSYYNKVPIYHIMFSLLYCEGIILILLERDCVN